MPTARQEAIRSIASSTIKLDYVDYKSEHITEAYGKNVFSEEVAQARLPKPIFKVAAEGRSRRASRWIPASPMPSPRP